MEQFDKRMALDVIEDALTNLDTPENCGMAAGLCGAFYMCGLLNQREWQNFLGRIMAKNRQLPDFYATVQHCDQTRH